MSEIENPSTWSALLRPFAGGGGVFGKILAHAHFLGALSGEKKNDLAHVDSKCRNSVTSLQPARSAIPRVVAASIPLSPNSARAASISRCVLPLSNPCSEFFSVRAHCANFCK
jgi:hypothetical protein